MTPERLAEIKAAAAKLTYLPTKQAADELIAEVERLRAALFRIANEGPPAYFETIAREALK